MVLWLFEQTNVFLSFVVHGFVFPVASRILSKQYSRPYKKIIQLLPYCKKRWKKYEQITKRQEKTTIIRKKQKCCVFFWFLQKKKNTKSIPRGPSFHSSQFSSKALSRGWLPFALHDCLDQGKPAVLGFVSVCVCVFLVRFGLGLFHFGWFWFCLVYLCVSRCTSYMSFGTYLDS